MNKEPTWKETLKIIRKQVAVKLAPMKQVMLDICMEKDKIRCPYCNYQANDLEDLRDHLTYYHWMSTPSVDESIKEIKGNKCTGTK